MFRVQKIELTTNKCLISNEVPVSSEMLMSTPLLINLVYLCFKYRRMIFRVLLNQRNWIEKLIQEAYKPSVQMFDSHNVVTLIQEIESKNLKVKIIKAMLVQKNTLISNNVINKV